MDALAVDHKRLDELMLGLTFAIARSPEQFLRITGTSVSIAKTDCYPNAPALRIFFTYNPYEVHLLWLEFME